MIEKNVHRRPCFLCACLLAGCLSLHLAVPLLPAAGTDDGRRADPNAESTITRTWMPEAQPPVDPNLPTLFLIGDSTVRAGSRGNGQDGLWGWGSALGDFFDRTRINVVNRALGGTSSRTFRTRGLWAGVLADLKPGDFVIMQFGHNDGGPLDDNRRARGTIKGNGEQTRQIDNPLTGKRELVHTYGWYLRQYIRETRAAGAVAIVCSPIPRNRWTADGKVIRSSRDYGGWAAEAARAGGALFLDLNERIAVAYESEGPESVSTRYFGPTDHTHTTAAGALCNAARVAEGIRDLTDCPLRRYLREPNRQSPDTAGRR